eukprot:2585140-Amphidinium_carterae.1
MNIVIAFVGPVCMSQCLHGVFEGIAWDVAWSGCWFLPSACHSIASVLIEATLVTFDIGIHEC